MKIAFSNLDAQRQIGGKLIVILAWAMIPVVLGARLAVHEPMAGVTVASLLTAVGATLAWRFGGEANRGPSPHANLIETQCHGFDMLEHLCGPISSVAEKPTMLQKAGLT